MIVAMEANGSDGHFLDRATDLLDTMTFNEEPKE